MSFFRIIIVCLIMPVLPAWSLVMALPAEAEDYQWGNVAIGGGGYVTGLVASCQEPGLIYARTDVGGAYRWDEEHYSWTPLTDWVGEEQVGLLGIEALALDPQHPERLYMTAGIDYFNDGRSALLRSDDYGSSFDVLPLSEFKVHGNGMGRQNGERLAVDPNNPDILYAGSRRNGLFRSLDRGETWDRVHNLEIDVTPNDNGIVFVLPDGSKVEQGITQRIIVGVSNASLDPGQPEYNDYNLFITEDAGETWTLIEGRPGKHMPQRAVLSAEGDLIITYANGAGPHPVGHLPEPVDEGSVWKWNISDRQWQDITPSGYSRGFGGVSIDPGQPNRIVVSTINAWYNQGDDTFGDRFFYSVDGGANWTDLVSEGLFEKNNRGIGWIDGHSVHWAGSLLIDPFRPERVFSISGNGIFMTEDISDVSEPWKFMVDGLEETVPLDLIAVPGGPLVSVIGDYDGFRHDDIREYAPIHEPQIGTSTGIAYAANQPAFIVRAGGSSDGSSFPLYYSEDMGLNWNEMASTPENRLLYQGHVAVSADASVVLWKPANDNRIYRTADRGQSWTPSEGIRFNTTIPVSDPVNPQMFYAYNPADGSIAVSDDGGRVFEYGPELPRNGSARIRPAPGLEGDLWVALEHNGLYRSQDQAVSFEPVSSVQRASAIGFGKHPPGMTYPAIYMWGTVDHVTGLFRSDNEGASWVRINDDRHQFGGPGNANLVIGDPDVYGKVYMSTAGRGIVYGSLARSTSTEVVTRENAEEWKLGQNYPNPFNPTTVIPFYVPEASHVRLTIYDYSGRRVWGPVDDYYLAGEHRVHFNAGAMSSGLYIYRIQSSGYTQSKKMMLIR
ncbi:T9SS type A sorting domain-containing protein [Balneolaceae bacterium ANBcel3]|nr:T9SS type A sorting domain-containing protein [Balneolaceae bacterium ANBcel3]